MDFIGTAGRDTFIGGAERDTITGLDGNDRLAGGRGADLISGGNDNDVLFSGDQSIIPDIYNLGKGIVLDDGRERDTVSGDSGNDTIFAGYGDTIDGGTGTDRLAISFGGATSGVSVSFSAITSGASVSIGATTISNIETLLWVRGSDFDDLLDASNAAVGGGFAIEGGDGNDHIITDGLADRVYGGNGNDLIENGNNYYSYIYAGDGDDIVTSGQYWTDGGAGNDTIASLAYALGGDGDDHLTAYNDSSHFGAHLAGGAGTDTIDGSDNKDVLSGGTGADTINGGDGDDLIFSASRNDDFQDFLDLPTDDIGSEHDLVSGGNGNDTISIGYGDDADGGAGIDRLALSAGGATRGVTIDTDKVLTGRGSFGGGTITGFEEIVRVRGSDFADRITTTAAIVEGGGGSDRITITGQQQLIIAGEGDDRFFTTGRAGNLYGDGGSDTIDYSRLAAAAIVDLGELNSDFDFGTGTDSVGNSLHDIENIAGSAFGDALSGSGLANHIEGKGGNDSIAGGIGADWLEGGAGDDEIYITAWNPSIGMERLSGGTGYDTLILDQSAGYRIDLSTARIRSDFEALSAPGADLILRAAQLKSVSTLTAASVSLVGSGTVNFSSGSFSGPLFLSSQGNTAILDSAHTHLVYGGAGADKVTGGNAVDQLYGGAGNDVLTGGGGADLLDGGTGNDRLIGGLGDDRYIVDSTGDVVIETTGGGIDSVISSADFGLGAEIENLTLLDGAIKGTGNALANVIIGNAADNILNGGTGDDTLIGGGGNDIYVVASSHAAIVENAFEGVDIVYASADFTLGDNIENLSLQGNAHAGTGNALANRIAGTPGDDVLDGLGGNDYLSGGLGADIMRGGDGDDTYIVDNAGDTVIEAGGGGSDAITTSVDYTLPDEVESLTLTGNAHSGTGNSAINVLIGAAGGDTLSGLGGNDVISGEGGNDILIGGTGQDVLFGGTGADIFLFRPGDSSASYLTADGIVDFNKVEGDRIDLVAFGHLSFIGGSGFSGAAGQVRYENFDGDTLISIDTNGDRQADVVIGLIGAPPLAATDFILG